jgi:hypothetical protein
MHVIARIFMEEPLYGSSNQTSNRKINASMLDFLPKLHWNPWNYAG